VKILLINSPIRLDAEPNCIPYGLATIAAVLRAQGFDVEIYDVNALQPPREHILSTLKERKPGRLQGSPARLPPSDFRSG